MKSIVIALMFMAATATAQKETILLIPKIHLGYGIDKASFIKENNFRTDEIHFKNFVPEIYGGLELIAYPWAISLDWGFLQKTILLGAGYVIPLKVKDNKKKHKIKLY